MKTSRVLASLLFSIMAAYSTAAAAQTTHSAPSGYAGLDQYVKPAESAVLNRFAAPSGASFHETVNKWLAQAGWRPVVWRLPEDTDFTLGAPSRFDTDIGQAVMSLAASLGSEATLSVTVDEKSKTVTLTILEK